jgi:hypothetical protein
MSEDTRVLIIGDPQDPIPQTLEKHCKEAKCQVLRYHSDQIYDFHPRQPQHIVFYTYPVQYLADQVLGKSVVHPYGVVFLASHSDWALGKLLPEHESQVLGFNAFGLYAGRTAIEVAATLKSDPDTVERGTSFLTNMGFKPYVVRETPGFVFPRILAMLVNEAISALMEGVASAEAIDEAMRLGTNYPQGPLAWADQIGLDVILEVLDNLQAQYGEDRYRPMPLLTQMVMAGKLGRKTGEGFYTYAPEPETEAISPA